MSMKSLSVRDVMITHFVSFRPEMDIYDAIDVIVDRGLMGAPVVEHNRLVGVFSEKDACRVLANWVYGMENEMGGSVGDHMTRDVLSVDAGVDVATVTSRFLEHFYRGLPVVEKGVLVGLVSRQDITKAMVRMHKRERAERFEQGKYGHQVPELE